MNKPEKINIGDVIVVAGPFPVTQTGPSGTAGDRSSDLTTTASPS